MNKEEAIELLEEMKERCNMPTATDEKRYLKSDALDIAITSVNKQIEMPVVEKIHVEPVQDSTGAYVDADTYLEYYCPVCDTWVGSDYGDIWLYCPTCGQRLSEVKNE